jgi:hypothetical protein
VYPLDHVELTFCKGFAPAFWKVPQPSQCSNFDDFHYI